MVWNVIKDLKELPENIKRELIHEYEKKKWKTPGLANKNRKKRTNYDKGISIKNEFVPFNAQSHERYYEII